MGIITKSSTQRLESTCGSSQAIIHSWLWGRGMQNNTKLRKGPLESGSLQEVVGGFLSVNLKLVGIIGGVHTAAGGWRHRRHRRGGSFFLQVRHTQITCSVICHVHEETCLFIHSVSRCSWTLWADEHHRCFYAQFSPFLEAQKDVDKLI